MAVFVNCRRQHCQFNDAVEAHSCVDMDSKTSLDEQYTTVDKHSMEGCFDPKVFVKCQQYDLAR